MDLGEVDVLDVVGQVVVLDLAAGPGRVSVRSPPPDPTKEGSVVLPVQTLNLDRLAVLDGARKGDCLRQSSADSNDA